MVSSCVVVKASLAAVRGIIRLSCWMIRVMHPRYSIYMNIVKATMHSELPLQHTWEKLSELAYPVKIKATVLWTDVIINCWITELNAGDLRINKGIHIHLVRLVTTLKSFCLATVSSFGRNALKIGSSLIRLCPMKLLQTSADVNDRSYIKRHTHIL